MVASAPCGASFFGSPAYPFILVGRPRKRESQASVLIWRALHFKPKAVGCFG